MPGNIRNLTSNLPILGLLGASFLGWFLTFVGACVISSQTTVYQVIWFFVCYHLVLILGLTASIVYDAVAPHRLVITAFLVSGFVWTVDALTAATPAAPASGPATIVAGNIFLVLSYIPLIIIFASDDSSPISAIAPTVFGDSQTSLPSANPSAGFFGVFTKSANPQASPASSSFTAVPVPAAPVNVPMQGMPYSSAAAGAYEAPQPHPAATASFAAVPSAPAPPSAGAYAQPQSAPAVAAPAAAVTVPASIAPASAAAPAPVQFVCKAKALYSYTANPEDPKEISFSKGDVLEILDNKGKWWHARRINVDGTDIVGIAPSNYLQVI
ncbi:Transmembrane osmosensor [Dinochytrium kinnereticum]|nr:Transmembrane osmosensor [Dinochytrium kinnereticum]